LSGLKEELSPGRQLKRSLQKHPLGWALSAAGASFLLARLIRRPKVVYAGRRKSWFALPLGARLALRLARPAITSFALRKAREHLESRFNPPEDNSMLGGSPQK
jgi:hypothetical protein